MVSGVTQDVRVPKTCPSCGAVICLEYTGHQPLDHSAPSEAPSAVHCSTQHDEDSTCDFRQQLDLDKDADWYNIVPVGETVAA